MAYELHIVKDSKDIELSEWVEAVRKTDGAQLDTKPQRAKNPKTGEVITIGGNSNNVAVKFVSSKMFSLVKSEKWVSCIFFRNGRASFNATEDIESTNNPVKTVASSLANALDAKIVGDDGKTYNW